MFDLKNIDCVMNVYMELNGFKYKFGFKLIWVLIDNR